MIKNNKIKTCVVGACIIANTLTMTAFADTNTGAVTSGMVQDKTEVMQSIAPDTQASSDDRKVYKTMELQVQPDEKMLAKQLEIDRYLFADHVEEIAQKGFTVTHTLVAGDKVEIGITPYSQENAAYLGGLFGKDMISVVAGEQPELMQVSLAASTDAAPAQVADMKTDIKSESKVVSFINSILNWFKNLI